MTTTLKFRTYNVGFNFKPKTAYDDIKNHVLIHGVDGGCLQEVKYLDLEKHKKFDENFEFYHETDKGLDNAGSACFWDKRVLHKVAQGQTLGVKPGRFGMLTRWITWVTLVTNEGVRLDLVSVHLPPKRYWALTPFYIARLLAFILTRKNAVIVGGDWNKLVRYSQELINLARRVKGKFFGKGIDGFLVVPKGKIKVTKTTVQEAIHPHSHHMITITTEVGRNV